MRRAVEISAYFCLGDSRLEPGLSSRPARLAIQRQRAALRRLGPGYQLLHGRVVEPVEYEHLAAREERAIELEGRILRGRADQDDRAVLDIGQESILLRAIEAVNLVDEQQRPLARQATTLGGLEDLAQIRHAGEHCRQRLKMQVRAVGQQAG